MFCRDIMRRPVICARRGDSVQSVAQKMRDSRVGFLPVCDDRDHVVGVVTDRDIVIRLCAAGQSAVKMPVEAIMTVDVLSCAPDADIGEAERLMAQERKSRIVVVGESGAAEGVISLSDLAGRGEATELLRQVAEREVLDESGKRRKGGQP